MNFTTILFYILSIVLIYAAFRVITAKSPVTAVLHLIFAFFNAAMLWVMMGAEFLGLLLVLVYVGAVMVLFLFVVMMIDIKNETLRDGLRTYLPLGLFIGGVLVVEMSFVLMSGWGNVGPAVPIPDDYNNARSIGELMYTQYAFAVQVGAALLLVGMIAAIALTLRHRKDSIHTSPGDAVRVKAKDRLRMVNMPSQESVTAKTPGDSV